MNLSDLLYKIKLEKEETVIGVSLSYGGETITLEDSKTETGEKKAETKAFQAVRDEKAKTFADKNNVPNAILTFKTETKTASDLKVAVVITNKAKKTADASVNIKVRVLPETMKPVKAITQNLKLSQDLKDYDFDVRARNIADTAADTVSAITVKKSNVKFGKAGHYEVTYEVKTKPDSLDVATDVEVVDKETEKNLPKDDVTKENAKPGNTVEVITDAETVDKKDESVPEDTVITDNKDTAADSGVPSGGNAAPDNSAPSGGGSTDSGSSAPAHTHSWTPHTATKQVWVPNIVTVTDYATQAAHKCDTRCSECGAVFGSPDECADHKFATGHGGSQNIACTHTTQVVVGTHTEDHGYNETQSYTDYYYCSCGATKSIE